MPDSPDLDARRSSYSSLSAQLVHLDDREFSATFKAPGPHRGPWGHSYASEFNRTKVFVKRIPLTEAEAARPWSTRNAFKLPPYYNYGVGSAGFGAFRELVAHMKTTNWVLQGATHAFPMLVHHRVLRRVVKPGKHRTLTPAYVAHWNGSRAVGDYMQARAAAPAEIWLILEYVPHRMSDWIWDHQDQVDDIVEQLFAAIALMRRNDMVHFDLHFGNVLTDGTTARVTDFGLINDENFHLTKNERSFLRRHDHYDYGTVIGCLGLTPWWKLFSLEEAARRPILRRHPWLDSANTHEEVARGFLEHVDSMTSGPLKVHPVYAQALRRYAPVVLYMTRFISAMRSNPRKNTPYDDEHVRRLLEQAGAPINP